MTVVLLGGITVGTTNGMVGCICRMPDDQIAGDTSMVLTYFRYWVQKVEVLGSQKVEVLGSQNLELSWLLQ